MRGKSMSNFDIKAFLKEHIEEAKRTGDNDKVQALIDAYGTLEGANTLKKYAGHVSNFYPTDTIRGINKAADYISDIKDITERKIYTGEYPRLEEKTEEYTRD